MFAVLNETHQFLIDLYHKYRVLSTTNDTQGFHVTRRLKQLRKTLNLHGLIGAFLYTISVFVTFSSLRIRVQGIKKHVVLDSTWLAINRKYYTSHI